MRRTPTACRTGVSMAAAVVLLSACGGSDEEGSAPRASESTSEAPSASGSEFCTQAASVQERLEATVSDQSDPTQLPAILDEAATEIRSIEAPEEIAADWSALAGGVEQFSAAIAGIDFTDPGALATLDQQLTPLQEQLDSASTNVSDYLRDECGIDVPGN